MSLIPVAPLLKGWIFKPFRRWTVRSEEHRAKSERAETRGCLSRVCGCTLLIDMSATEIIEQFKALPAAERAQVAKFVVENDDSWIPESFKQGMADAAAGRFADMETVLSGAKPPSRAAE